MHNVYQFLDRVVGQRKSKLSGFNLGEVEDVVDEPEEMSAVPLDAFDGGSHSLRRIAVYAVEHELRKAEHRVQWRPQFMTHVGEELRFVTAGLLKTSVELLQLFAGRIHMRRKLPEFVTIGDLYTLGEITSRYPIQPVVNDADRFDHRPGDRMSQDQRKHKACERDRSDKYLGFGVSSSARIYAGHHVRFSPVDQLIGQSFELVRERPEFREFALFGLSCSSAADEIDDV